MFVPEPVIKVAVSPAVRDGADRLSKALHRFRRESDAAYLDRRRDQRDDHGRHGGVAPGNLYRADSPRVRRGSQWWRAKVNYREVPTQACKFNTKHKKQTGGSGQYAHIVGQMEPLPEDSPRDLRLRG